MLAPDDPALQRPSSMAVTRSSTGAEWFLVLSPATSWSTHVVAIDVRTGALSHVEGLGPFPTEREALGHVASRGHQLIARERVLLGYCATQTIAGVLLGTRLRDRAVLPGGHVVRGIEESRWVLMPLASGVAAANGRSQGRAARGGGGAGPFPSARAAPSPSPSAAGGGASPGGGAAKFLATKAALSKATDRLGLSSATFRGGFAGKRAGAPGSSAGRTNDSLGEDQAWTNGVGAGGRGGGGGAERAAGEGTGGALGRGDPSPVVGTGWGTLPTAAREAAGSPSLPPDLAWDPSSLSPVPASPYSNLSTSDLPEWVPEPEADFWKSLGSYSLAGTHYYCDTADLTRPFPSPEPQARPSSRAVWNAELRAPFAGLLGLPEACPPLLQGACEARDARAPRGDRLSIVLLTRRSSRHAGTRYLARGLNELAEPGNEADCDLLAWTPREGERGAEPGGAGFAVRRPGERGGASSAAPAAADGGGGADRGPRDGAALGPRTWGGGGGGGDEPIGQRRPAPPAPPRSNAPSTAPRSHPIGPLPPAAAGGLEGDPFGFGPPAQTPVSPVTSPAHGASGWGAGSGWGAELRAHRDLLRGTGGPGVALAEVSAGPEDGDEGEGERGDAARGGRAQRGGPEGLLVPPPPPEGEGGGEPAADRSVDPRGRRDEGGERARRRASPSAPAARPAPAAHPAPQPIRFIRVGWARGTVPIWWGVDQAAVQMGLTAEVVVRERGPYEGTLAYFRRLQGRYDTSGRGDGSTVDDEAGPAAPGAAGDGDDRGPPPAAAGDDGEAGPEAMTRTGVRSPAPSAPVPVTCINLLHCNPKKASELLLTTHFQEGVRQARRALGGDTSQLHILNFDWHGAVGTLGEERGVEAFWAFVEPCIKAVGFDLGEVSFGGGGGEPSGRGPGADAGHRGERPGGHEPGAGDTGGPGGPPPGRTPGRDSPEPRSPWRVRYRSRQRGVLRFNCADSLDRTNAAAGFAMLPVLVEAVRQLGVDLDVGAGVGPGGARRPSSAPSPTAPPSAPPRLSHPAPSSPSLSRAAAPPPLPPGWEVRLVNGRPLYIDHNARSTQWDPPATAAPAEPRPVTTGGPQATNADGDGGSLVAPARPEATDPRPRADELAAPAEAPRHAWSFFEHRQVRDVRDCLGQQVLSAYVDAFRAAGDVHSLLYTGSPAMHSHMLGLLLGARAGGVASGVGRLQNLRVAVQRRWNNAVSDGARQRSIELFLGVDPTRNAPGVYALYGGTHEADRRDTSIRAARHETAGPGTLPRPPPPPPPARAAAADPARVPGAPGPRPRRRAPPAPPGAAAPGPPAALSARAPVPSAPSSAPSGTPGLDEEAWQVEKDLEPADSSELGGKYYGSDAAPPARPGWIGAGGSEPSSPNAAPARPSGRPAEGFAEPTVTTLGNPFCDNLADPSDPTDLFGFEGASPGDSPDPFNDRAGVSPDLFDDRAGGSPDPFDDRAGGSPDPFDGRAGAALGTPELSGCAARAEPGSSPSPSEGVGASPGHAPPPPRLDDPLGAASLGDADLLDFGEDGAVLRGPSRARRDSGAEAAFRDLLL